jgi:hypothetical protein
VRGSYDDEGVVSGEGSGRRWMIFVGDGFRTVWVRMLNFDFQAFWVFWVMKLDKEVMSDLGMAGGWSTSAERGCAR